MCLVVTRVLIEASLLLPKLLPPTAVLVQLLLWRRLLHAGKIVESLSILLVVALVSPLECLRQLLLPPVNLTPG